VNDVLKVAEHEFSILARSPIVLLFSVLIVIIAIINAAGYSSMVSSNSYGSGVLMNGVSNFFDNVSTFLAFLTMCIGILSVADERWKGSFRVLFTKPLYRRDAITGKFIGISALLFLTIAFTLTLFVSLMMAVYIGQESITDLALRMLSFAFLMFLNCCFTLGLVMCLGILLNKPEAIMVSIAFITFEWLTNTGSLPGGLQLVDPGCLYFYTLYTASGQLLNTSSPFSSWFNGALPYIVLMAAEAVIIVLVSCMLFNREEA
jgi:ABC-2 type transport system permease protein